MIQFLQHERDSPYYSKMRTKKKIEIFGAETTTTSSILTTSSTNIQSIGGWLEIFSQ